MHKENVVQLDPVARLWSRADKARATGMDAYLEFCQALAELNAAGITQEEIGKRYDMSQSKIMQSIRVGNDPRISRNPTNLPRGESTLYLLATLDDNDFQRFAKPETVEHDIRDYKAAKRQPKKRQFKIGWIELLLEKYGTQQAAFSGGDHRKSLRARIKKELGIEPPSYFYDEQEAEKFVLAVAPLFANTSSARPKLSDTAEQKLQRAIAIETKRLQDSFYDEVHKEVVRRIPEVRAQWEKDMSEAREEAARYAMLSNSIVKKISSEEYKFLLNLLHPDRQPEDRRERFGRGFNIVMRLKEYAES